MQWVCLHCPIAVSHHQWTFLNFNLILKVDFRFQGFSDIIILFSTFLKVDFDTVLFMWKYLFVSDVSVKQSVKPLINEGNTTIVDPYKFCPLFFANISFK